MQFSISQDRPIFLGRFPSPSPRPLRIAGWIEHLTLIERCAELSGVRLPHLSYLYKSPKSPRCRSSSRRGSNQSSLRLDRHDGPPAEQWLSDMMFNSFAGRVKISRPKPRAFFNSRSRSHGFLILEICRKPAQLRRKGKYQGETRRTPSRPASIRGKSVP